MVAVAIGLSIVALIVTHGLAYNIGFARGFRSTDAVAKALIPLADEAKKLIRENDEARHSDG